MRVRTNTLEVIHQEAIKEFLANGLEKASLRQIVKNAGVTTGAFYGYYDSKAALYDALVEPLAKKLESIFSEHHQTKKSFFEGRQMLECILEMYEEAFNNHAIAMLLLQAPNTSKYSHFYQDLAEKEWKASCDYLKTTGKDTTLKKLNRHFAKIQTEGLFKAFGYLLRHEVTSKEAENCFMQYISFNEAGWQKILND